MTQKMILEEKTMKGFRYQLRKSANRFVIFSLDTRIILPQLLTEPDWKTEADFGNEIKARKAFNGLFKD